MRLPCHAIVIDDEAWIREGLVQHIDWHRMQITFLGAFSDGDEALGFLRQAPVDLIISDIRMPHMSGLELLRFIREEAIENSRLQRTKVIFLSGFGDFSYAQEALRLGATDFLLKPADVEMIEQALLRAKDQWATEMEYDLQRSIRLGHPNRSSGKGSVASEQQPSHLVTRALYLMMEHYTEDIQLGQIADSLYVTPNYLSRLFRQETGLSFSEQLSQIRLKKACELLISSPSKIYQVGESVGYPNSRYFSEWFQKQTGMTPGEYRNKHLRR